MILTLPGMIYRYFAAQAASDFEGMAACFAPNGSIRDRTSGANGPSAIRDWVAAKSAHGRTTQLLRIGRRDEATVVVAAAVGDRPDPAPVEHRFQFESGMIIALELC